MMKKNHKKTLALSVATCTTVLALTGCSSFRVPGWNDGCCDNNYHAATNPQQADNEWNWSNVDQQPTTAQTQQPSQYQQPTQQKPNLAARSGFMQHQQPQAATPYYNNYKQPTQTAAKAPSHFWQDRYGMAGR